MIQQTLQDLGPVGYIGLGIMGAPMARNLLRAGVPVQVWARRREAVQPLAAAGATVCEDLAELVSAVRVLFLNVSDTPDVESLVLGPTGILTHAAPGLVIVDHSTIDPVRTIEVAQRCREVGIHFVDCPVSGGESGAIAGTLTLMLGGDAGVIERIRPLLECVGKTLTHVGTSGAGQIAKACNQLVIGETLLAVAEAFALAEAAGVDPARVREALLGGFAASRVLETHGRRILEQDFKPGFFARLHRKDMDIVASTARVLKLDLPGVGRVQRALQQAVDAGDGELDSSVLANYGLERQPPNSGL